MDLTHPTLLYIQVSNACLLMLGKNKPVVYIVIVLVSQDSNLRVLVYLSNTRITKPSSQVVKIVKFTPEFVPMGEKVHL